MDPSLKWLNARDDCRGCTRDVDSDVSGNRQAFSGTATDVRVRISTDRQGRDVSIASILGHGALLLSGAATHAIEVRETRLEMRSGDGISQASER
jgi:hypothetical protein